VTNEPSSSALSSDFGWGDSDADGLPAWGGIGSVLLLIASGIYGASLWLAGGLPPLPYLAARVRRRADGRSQGDRNLS
jgi:hypothetical protein